MDVGKDNDAVGASTRRGHADADGRPTGPGAACWCDCGEAIPEGVRSNACFIASHKDAYHNRRRAGGPKESPTGSSSVLTGEWPAAMYEARLALERLEQLSARVCTRLEEAEQQAKAATARALAAESALADARNEVQLTRTCKDATAPTDPLAIATDSTTASAAATVESQAATAGMVRSALMVAVRSERSRATAAEAQIAALTSLLERVLAASSQCAGVSSASPATNGSGGTRAAVAPPYSVRPSRQRSVTVPVAAAQKGGDRPVNGPFGSLARLDHDGLLTLDEARELLTATAMRVVAEVGGRPGIGGLLDGSLPADGLAPRAASAVEAHQRTLARLLEQGLGDVVDGIVEGAVCYADPDRM